MHAHTIRHYQLCCKHNVSLEHYFPLKASKCRKFCDWNNFSAVIFLGRLFYIWLPPCLLYEQLVWLLWRENRSICKKEEIHLMELDAHMHAHMNTHTHTHTHTPIEIFSCFLVHLFVTDQRNNSTTMSTVCGGEESQDMMCTFAQLFYKLSWHCEVMLSSFHQTRVRDREREVSEWGRCYWC